MQYHCVRPALGGVHVSVIVRTRHETDSHVLLLSQYVDFNVGDVVLCV